MPISIIIKTVKPKKRNQKFFRWEFSKSMTQTGKDMLKDFKKTTKTWNTKPEFEVLKDLNPPDYSVLVGTDDKIYGYVDEGTKVRRAIMSKDFIAKTTPNVIDSRPGRGGVVFISKKVARPGIKARNFAKLIGKKWKKPFKTRMEKAMKAAAIRMEQG